MISDRPRLRRELIISRIDEAGPPSYVIKDPLTNNYFRCGEYEYFIARQLDGRTPLWELQLKFNREFSTPMPLSSLEEFISQLQSLGFIEEEAPESRPLLEKIARERRRPLLQRLLFIKLKAFNPDRFLSWLAGHVRFIFTPYFVTFSLLLMLGGAGVFIANGGEIWQEMRQLYHLRNLLQFWLVIFLLISLHELAHGMTCKHFGGEVNDMGFLLLYFQPCFYCNVSDAWLFRERRQRMWVSFAGIFFDLVLFSSAAILWRISAQETWVNHLCLVVMVVAGVGVLFNLNPLIKLDGYYLLSDYLLRPNLRQRAFGYLRSLIGPHREEVEKREKRIYLSYGLLGGAYSVTLIGYLAFKGGKFLTDRYHGAGLILFLILLLLAFQDILREGVAKLIPRSEREMKSPMKRGKKLVVTLIILIGGGLLLCLVRMELRISSESQLMPVERAIIRAEVEGILDQILVKEGDKVQQGEVVASISPREYEMEIKRNQAELAEKRANLRLLKRGPRPEEIDQMRKRVEKARTQVEFATKEVVRVGKLYQEELVSDKEMEEAQQNLSLYSKELEEAQADLNLLLAGYRKERIEAAQAEIERLQASLDYLLTKRKLTEVVSPISGVVTTRLVEERVKEYLEEGGEICRVENYYTVRLEISVPEKEIADVKVGSKIKFKCRSFPARNFYGTVSSIAPVAAKGERSQVVRVISQISNPTLELKPGMSGNAKIYCGKRRLIFIFTRRIIRFLRTELWW